MELRAREAARLTRLIVAASLAAIALLALGAPADAGAAPKLVQPVDPDAQPKGYKLTPAQAILIAGAEKSGRVLAEKRRHRGLKPTAYTSGPGRWQVSYFQGKIERAQVVVDDDQRVVLEAWTGAQVQWRMARGYEGAFGRTVNAPYVWLPLCLLFVLPFIDPRRPFRLLHLDLLVLLSFGLSHAFFNRGEIGASVPLAYPVLLYLLARMLWAGFRPRERRDALVPLVPVAWLAVGLLFLVGFRVGLNVVDSNVIDVGYAGVIGADRIADGDDLYGAGFATDNQNGDTYGPANYLAYVPFEQVWPWSGSWDDLPAAHGAAVAFDLMTLLGLLLLGRRLRPGRDGRALGVALAFAWASFPYTLFVLESNSNDSLVALLVVLALLGVTWAPVRGAMVGLAGAAKLAPLALAPLFARGVSCEPKPRRRRGLVSVVLYSLALVAVLAAAFVPFIPDGGLSELYNRTLGFQAGRDSPFSIWGQQPGLGWLHTGVKAAAVLLALLVAVVPRRRDAAQLAALAAAVVIALQLATTHWFYLYVVWFAPLVFAALFARHPTTAEQVQSPAHPPALTQQAMRREPALAPVAP